MWPGRRGRHVLARFSSSLVQVSLVLPFTPVSASFNLLCFQKNKKQKTRLILNYVYVCALCVGLYNFSCELPFPRVGFFVVVVVLFSFLLLFFFG